MIADLKPYAEYKDSGLPWLGQVPGHWPVPHQDCPSRDRPPLWEWRRNVAVTHSCPRLVRTET